ncbi:VWA domain-containing protein [Nocardia sp. NBC_00565]|uniref:vWA domain-containing protein n=1 Tax=Nocardia sp. NBC_00565 TaxID=2975993 RepID=UPI002E8248CB|nr:vWA domain-containing protein [Nocardia sp. NBC_00565]WUC01568.1 VWA domain-containing protein [Nocardia sp. NBC_00565]
MTNSDLTLIAVLLDRSGSMQSIKSDTEGGFDAYVEEQRKVPKTTLVTLAQFDTEYELVYANRPIGAVPPLSLQPRGGTALYDAVGRLVTDVGSELAARPEHERPGTVIVVVLTDGHENSSREWTHPAVKALITQQQESYSWDFVFLGANMDAVAVGSALGFDPRRSLTYGATPAGAAGVFASAAAYSARRSMAAPGQAVDGFTDAERKAANPDGK